MPFFTMLLVYVATFLITELLRPKPNIENAKPAGLGDFQVPTATEGRVVPIIFGRVLIKGPNVVWYGDLSTSKIRQKVKTGVFSSSKQTIGFKYFLGLQCALCRGPLDGPDDKLWNIRNDDSNLWGVDVGDAALNPSLTGANGSIDNKTFFGDKSAGGENDGIIGNFTIYSGEQLQTVDSYISGVQSPAPAYRGTCYWIWKKGYIGNSPQLRNFEYELSRYSDGLDLAGNGQAADVIVDHGTNPMNVFFEILNNSEWGLNISSSQINVINLRALAATLATEGQGFAWIWDRVFDIGSIIRQIEEQTDGVMFQDPLTGVYDFVLVRDDYTPGTLPLLDETNCLDVTKFRRPSWDSTSNVVNVQFIDRRKNYTTSYAIAQDSANIDIVQSVNAVEVKFPGVKSAVLANSLAWRELRLLSYPVATGKLIANRTQYALKPGDVRELTWSRLGLVRLPIRITKIDRGNILKGQISIDYSEDIFAAQPGSFSDPIDSGWTPPDDTAQAILFEMLIEVPYAMTNVDDSGVNTIAVQIGTLTVRGGSFDNSYNTFATAADVPTIPPDPTEGDVVPPGGADAFTPYGLLQGALDSGQTNGFQDAVGFVIDNMIDVTESEVGDTDAAGLENLVNALLIDDEIILFSTVINAGVSATIRDLVRGALDTLPAEHLDNSPVWIFSYGIGVVNDLPEGDITLNWKARNQSVTPFDAFNFAATVVQQIQSVGRAGKAYPPRDVEVNPAAPGGGYFPIDAGSPSGAELVGFLSLTWSGSDKFAQARATAWDDPHVAQEAGSAFRLRIIEDPTGAATVKLDISGIPAGATGAAYNAAGFADDTVSDEYQVELSSVAVNGESQIWTIGPFTIYGYGYKYDEKYGGDNAGVIIRKGDPSPTVDPIPGVVETSNFQVTVSGTFDSDDDLLVNINFLELGAAVSQNEQYFITGTTGGKTAIADYLLEIRDLVLADFDPIKVQAVVVGNVLTISSAFGSLGGSIFNNTAKTNISRVQERGINPSYGQTQVLHFDLWEGDTSTKPATEELAPAALVDYNAAPDIDQLYNKLILQVQGLSLEAKERLPAGGAIRTITWAGREVSPGTQAVSREIPLRDGATVGNYTTDLLSQLQKLQDEDFGEYIADVSWNRIDVSVPDDPQDRAGVEVTMKRNYKIVASESFESSDVNTVYQGVRGPVKLLGKEIVEGIRGLTSFDLSEIFRVSFDSVPLPGAQNYQIVTIGQNYTIRLAGLTFTEVAVGGDQPDSPYRDAIYSRLKTQIDTDGTYTATLNTAQRPDDSGTFVTSIDCFRVSGGNTIGLDWEASASFGLLIDVQQFDS